MLNSNKTVPCAAVVEDALTLSAELVPTIVPEALNVKLVIVRPFPSSGIVRAKSASSIVTTLIAALKFAPSPPMNVKFCAVTEEAKKKSAKSPNVTEIALAEMV